MSNAGQIVLRSYLVATYSAAALPVSLIRVPEQCFTKRGCCCPFNVMLRHAHEQEWLCWPSLTPSWFHCCLDCSRKENNDTHFHDTETGVELEVTDKQSLVEWIANNYKNFGATLEFITNRRVVSTSLFGVRG